MAGLLLAIVGREISDEKPGSELQKLRLLSQSIRTYVEGAEQIQLIQLNDIVMRKRLADAKSVYYDVIDVCDEWRIVQMKLREEKMILLSSSFLPCLSPVKRLEMPNHTARKMRRLTQKLEGIKEIVFTSEFSGTLDSEKEKLGSGNTSLDDAKLQCRDQGRETLRRVQSEKDVKSLEAKLKRQDEDREILSSRLLRKSPEDANIQCAAIVGGLGTGKTTIARSVYNSSEVLKHFHLRAWVSVSNVFDPTRILKEIIESITSKSYQWDEIALSLLIRRLRQIVEGKRFLFVLDHLSEVQVSNWKWLRDAFDNGAPRSVVLITTRTEEVASTAGSSDHMRLGELSKEDAWSLLGHVAFAEQNDQTEIKTFEEVGTKIVEKCRHLPLALRVVGGLLRTKTSVEDWKEVLEEFKSFLQSEGLLTSVFMLSYYYLDHQLRQCILYCSIFPENHSINVDKLIKLWMAQDYFDDTKGDMEAQGRHCFEELLSRSFFQNLRKDDHGNSLCSLHKQLVEFIRRVAESECAIEDLNEKDTKLPFNGARHWTLRIARLASSLIIHRHAEKVCTLMIVHRREYSFVDQTALSNLLRHFKRLRALDLSRCLLRELPHNIGELQHLRYLDFSFNHDLKKLPKELCDLSLLQTLNLNGCDSLKKLPKGIGKLIRLRHLEILWTSSLSYLPKGIRSLTSLRTLNRFIGIGDINGKACNLEDLGKLSSLQGYISIDGLGGVTDMALAKEASLKDKVGLRSLDLWFSGEGSDKEKEAAVLKALEPPQELECLGIFYYKGESFPDWTKTMQNLRHLMLSDCSECKILPPLGKLQLLETLEIRNMINLEMVGSEFLGTKSNSVDHGGEGETLAIRTDGGGNRNKKIMSNISDSGEKVMLTGSTSCDRFKEEISAIRAAAGGNRGKEKISDNCSGGGETIISTTESMSSGSGNVVFPELKKLYFHDLKNWKKWADIEVSGENVTIMPRLSTLSIVNCSSISAVPKYIKKKKTLNPHIEKCPNLTVELRRIDKVRRIAFDPQYRHSI